METTILLRMLRVLSAALLALTTTISLSAAHANAQRCIDIVEMHSAEEPISHHPTDATHEACCSGTCVICVGVPVTVATSVEADFSSAGFVLPAACLSGRTPAPGFKPPRSVA